MANRLWSSERQNPKASGDAATTAGEADPAGVRSLFQQDYDRLLFSTPVRRLADKTQVWPMDENDGIRTRLTHSHEVSNLARSIGTRVFKQVEALFEGACLYDVVQPILSAIGLAHDLGNPPFGHQGETAIANWFNERASWIFTHEDKEERSSTLQQAVKDELRDEFLLFDGNPQSLRLISKLQTHHRHVGLDLTAATLAASLKYPVCAANRDKTQPSMKKVGYFASEQVVVDWFRKETGLGEGERHPLTWIMEACDDVAYSVLDVDDLLKKGIISPDDVLTELLHKSGLEGNDTVAKIRNTFTKIVSDDRRAEILRDIKIGYLRAYLIESLIVEASATFVANATEIFALSHKTPIMEGSVLCETLKHIAKQYGFSHPSVLRSEAIGAVAIDYLMSAFWSAIHNRKNPSDLASTRVGARNRYVFSFISPNYLEQSCRPCGGDGADNLRYRELRLLTDMISGMTDTFAVKLWRDLKVNVDARSA